VHENKKNWDLRPDWAPEVLIFVLFREWEGWGTRSLWEYVEKRRCLRPCTIVYGGRIYVVFGRIRHDGFAVVILAASIRPQIRSYTVVIYAVYDCTRSYTTSYTIVYDYRNARPGNVEKTLKVINGRISQDFTMFLFRHWQECKDSRTYQDLILTLT